MALLLYFNGQLLDLEPGQAIAQTKQVNDLNSLETRQANYTNKFKVPKTGRNLKIMQYLTVPGNSATVPYVKNECSLYSDTGECFIYKGNGVVSDGGNYFSIVVYDGIVDLYKAIEGKNLSDINLSQYNHTRNMSTVTYSWTGASPALYIVADYNGKVNLTGTTWLNIDYLVPAYRVEFLWQQICFTYGIQWSGAVFATEAFKNLFLTYPKGLLISDDGNETVFDSEEYSFLSYNASGQNTTGNYYARFNSYETSALQQTVSNTHLTPGAAGLYRVVVAGRINGRRNTTPQYFTKGRLFLGKNAQGLGSNQVAVFHTIRTDIPHDEEFEITSTPFYLDANESICLMVGAFDNDSYKLFSTDANNHLHVQLERVEAADVNFEKAFQDFSIRDFFKEIMHRFGLTVYKDKYSNNYEFLTLQEVLQGAELVNWSSKYISTVSEKYSIGSYAKQNYFRYKYNDKEAAYNDGCITLGNENLEEEKTIIQSKIYSPENKKAFYLNQPGNVYKFWEKEVVDEPEEGESPIEYKALDKRFYLMRAENIYAPLTAVSLNFSQTANVTHYYRESFYRLGFDDILQDYYQPITALLDKPLMVTAEMWLTDNDVASFDFKKLYYIEQLGAYFIMNKINNYVQGKPTKCELVRVRYDQLGEPPLPVAINSVTIDNNYIVTGYTLTAQLSALTFEYSQDQQSWSSIVFNHSNSQYGYYLSAPGTWYIRIKAGNQYSNTVEVPIPSVQTITLQ